jgi:threonylcarbamoyladenosine tRNA methylthiotransferase MtaB
MSAKRVHLQTLGCRLNEAEIETWSRDFRRRGWRVVEDPAAADLLVINTCAVTAEATRKSRQLARRSRRANPSAKLVLSGCYATLEAQAAAQHDGVDLVVDNAHKDRLVERITQAFEGNSVPAQAEEPDAAALLARRRQRAFVKVQDGCRHRCTYCIVTLARGAERSRPVDAIVAEINRLHYAGVHEVVLTGAHLGGYGSDTGSSLGALIDAVLADSSLPRLRLGSLEPWNLDPEFWTRFANERLMPHLHLPLQSGSDSVLRRMARRCRTAEFQALAASARRAIPDLNITTDVIVGFPGETEAEWLESLRFIEAMAFGHIHIFAFSPREGTKAAILPDPVPRHVQRVRSAQLRALAEAQRHRQLARFVGRDFQVLAESHSQASGPGRKAWTGYTPNYLKVAFEADARTDCTNRILSVRTHGVDLHAGVLVAAATDD